MNKEMLRYSYNKLTLSIFNDTEVKVVKTIWG